MAWYWIVLIVWVLCLFYGWCLCSAASLVCDPQAGVTQYRLEDNGALGPAEGAEPDGSYRRDLAGFSKGPHVFRLQAADASGWWSEPSDPLSAGQKGKPGGVRIVP